MISPGPTLTVEPVTNEASKVFGCASGSATTVEPSLPVLVPTLIASNLSPLGPSVTILNVVAVSRLGNAA